MTVFYITLQLPYSWGKWVLPMILVLFVLDFCQSGMQILSTGRATYRAVIAGAAAATVASARFSAAAVSHDE